MLSAIDRRVLLPISHPKPLRPYQKQFVSDFYSHIRSGKKRILGVAATGSGKTVIAAQLVAHAVLKKRYSVFVVHRDILVEQTYKKLSDFGISECGFIKAGWQENRESLVQIASVQTLPKRDWWQQYPAGFIILDECHITAFSDVVKQMINHVFPDSLYLGLTATPWRLSKREGLGDLFESLVSAPTPAELIEGEYLVKPGYLLLSEDSRFTGR